MIFIILEVAYYGIYDIQISWVSYDFSQARLQSGKKVFVAVQKFCTGVSLARNLENEADFGSFEKFSNLIEELSKSCMLALKSSNCPNILWARRRLQSVT